MQNNIYVSHYKLMPYLNLSLKSLERLIYASKMLLTMKNVGITGGIMRKINVVLSFLLR